MIFQTKIHPNYLPIQNEINHSNAISHNVPDENNDAIPHRPFKSSINLMAKHPYLKKEFQNTREKLSQDYGFPNGEANPILLPPANSIAKGQNDINNNRNHKKTKSSLISGANIILKKN